MELPDGWIEHDGGPCPVEPSSRPGVIQRDGWTLEPGVGLAGGWSVGIDAWQHQGKFRAYDLIAYKPEPHP